MKYYQINEKDEVIELFNQRWYRIKLDEGEVFLRNVTTILDIIDKGPSFRNYLKGTGFRSDYILAKAGEFGDIFHEYTALYDSGYEISFFDIKNIVSEEIATELWQRIVRYAEYINSLEVEFVYIEKVIYSLKHSYAGRADRIVKYQGEYEVWDLKTGGDIYDSYFQQLAAYYQATKESLNLPIKRAKILWFPEKKTEFDEDGKIKYRPNKNGYRIVNIEQDKLEYYFDLFLSTKKIFDHYNKEEPTFNTLPIKIKRG